MILPVVRRELQIRARSRSTLLIRVGAAVVGVALAAFMILLVTSFTGPAVVGRTLFLILAWLGFIFCLCEGPRVASDSLSQERRNGTLGLLFLTDLRSYDVLLGKLAAAALNSFYGLMATFPALAVPLLIGGVTGAEFWRLVLALTVILFLSFCVAMCVSARSDSALSSLAGTLISLGVITSLPLIGLGFFRFSPWIVFHASLDGGYRASPSVYWSALAQSVGLSVALLAAAVFFLRRRWNAETIVASSRWSKRLATLLRPPYWLIQKNPVQWLVARDTRGALACRILVVVVFLSGAAVIKLLPPTSRLAAGILVGFVLLHLTLSVWISAVASLLLHRDRENGALEVLLCSPVSTINLVDGYLQGLSRIFSKPIALILVVEAFLAAYLFVIALGLVPWGIMVFTIILGAGTLISDYYALGWFGLWAGLTTRKHGAAIAKVVLLVLVLPLLVTSWCWPIWIGGAIVKNLVFITFARARLYEELRRRTSEPFPTPGRLPKPDRGRLPEILPRAR